MTTHAGTSGHGANESGTTEAAEDEPAHRVVVGVDGSPASIDAIRWAAGYAELIGAQVEAVCAVAVPTGFGAVGSAFDMVEITWVDTATRTLDGALSEALPKGSERIKRTLAWSNPAAALIGAADRADLLVVGSRGHGGFTGMLLGSVSAHLIAHAPCPVLVLRHAYLSASGTEVEPGDERGP